MSDETLSWDRMSRLEVGDRVGWHVDGPAPFEGTVTRVWNNGDVDVVWDFRRTSGGEYFRRKNVQFLHSSHKPTCPHCGKPVRDER